MTEQDLVPVKIVAILEEEVSKNPIIVLHDEQGNRVLPIWVGDSEARAIAIAMNNVPTPRPLTHQLMLAALEQCGARIAQIVVDDLEDHTYYATLYIKLGQRTIEADARPSDSIVLALLGDIPVFVLRWILDKAAQENPFEKRAGKELKLQQRIQRPIAQAKKNFTVDEMKRLKEMLDRARKLEEESKE